MGFNPSSYAKRQREIQRQRKRADKAKRRAERKPQTSGAGPGQQDPDIAGIVPGPQAQPWMEDHLGVENAYDDEPEK